MNNFSSFLLIFLIIISYYAVQVLSQKNKVACTSEQGNFDGSCLDVNECTGAALTGSCAKPNEICCIYDKPSATVDKNNFIQRETFLKIVGNTTRNNALFGYFVESMSLAQINDNYQAAAYLSQLAGESKYFRSLESDKSEKDFNPDIGNDGTGDGLKYKGRGAILLRGKSNYNAANNAKLSKSSLIILIQSNSDLTTSQTNDKFDLITKNRFP